MKPCIFCDINDDKLEHLLIAKQGPLKAVLDRCPITEGHILIISQTHESHLEHLTDDEYNAMFKFAQELGKQLPLCMEGVEDYNLLVNNGKFSGQHIPHVHLHLIPRRRSDTFGFYWRLLTRFINPFSSLGSDKNLRNVQRKWQATR
ncbi:HIT family protein [Vibrio sp. SCSIO 43140]|uniref:HIT family protein n=1 Tax=Vibrio sp. SCSIO 43140 TaxID=2819100 RepID=UPI002074DBCF|nr:HIT family protein [Vibrio sp. SCSIO 43140]USD63700.1 HIT family protein [Vibrio sp. SCSIO 43140]